MEWRPIPCGMQLVPHCFIYNVPHLPITAKGNGYGNGYLNSHFSLFLTRYQPISYKLLNANKLFSRWAL